MTARPDRRGFAEAAARSARRTWRLSAVLGLVVAGGTATTVVQLDPSAQRVDVSSGAGSSIPADAARSTEGLTCTDVAGCELACNHGRAPAPCVRLADKRLARPGATAQERDAARDAYRELCRRTGDALACTRLALVSGLLIDYAVAPDWVLAAFAPLPSLGAACAGGGERGALACAALELVGASPALAGPERRELCHGAAGQAPVACAAALALRRCRDDDDAEACHLAAADGLPTAPDARERLDALCNNNVRPACLYLWIRSGAQDLLLNACPDEHQDGVARACLERGGEPRGAILRERACELGSCQAASLKPAVVERACRDGHQLNACAALILANRTTPASWAPIFTEYRARIPAAMRPMSAAAVTGEQAACYLGSIAGCRLAVDRLAAGSLAERELARQLAAYQERLGDPLLPR